jgi:hypothetical protein
MSDAQRYRMNAAEFIFAAKRCESPYRRLTLSIAETWLSLARHEEAFSRSGAKPQPSWRRNTV